MNVIYISAACVQLFDFYIQLPSHLQPKTVHSTNHTRHTLNNNHFYQTNPHPQHTMPLFSRREPVADPVPASTRTTRRVGDPVVETPKRSSTLFGRKHSPDPMTTTTTYVPLSSNSRSCTDQMQPSHHTCRPLPQTSQPSSPERR